MLLRIRYIIIIFLLSIQFVVWSQKAKIDSLKNQIEISDKDTLMVSNLLKLATIYQRIDLDSSMDFSINALKISKVIKFYKGAANSYRQIGIIHYIGGDYEKAIDNFTLSLKSWEQEGDAKGIGRAYMNMGIIQKNMGDYQKALENYIKSSQIQQEVNDVDGLARSYNNIVNIYLELGDFESALDYSFKSLQIHEELDNKAEIAITLNNIGNIYHAQELEEKALEYNQKSLEINIELNDKKGMADNYNNLAEIYRNMVDKDMPKDSVNYFLNKGLYYLEKSLPLYEEVGYKKGIALSLNNIGSVNQQLGNFDKVLENFQKSMLAYKEMGDKNGIISSLVFQGSYYNTIKKYDVAIVSFEKAKILAEEIGAPERIKDIAEGLSISYSKLGNYSKAYENHVLFKEMTDKIISDANRKSSAQKEFRYKLGKQQKEMELEQQKKDILAAEELHRQSLITKGAFFGLALMVALAFFIFRSYRIKQKTNLQLADKNEQIIERNEELRQKNEEINAISEQVMLQRDIAVKAKKEVVDSIQYAERIQRAVLPAREMFDKTVEDYFIFFEPRDIVSGDFYWMKHINNHLVIVAADCTGHGVPGAFMSLLGVAFLNKIVDENTLDSGKILNSLREHIIEALHQTWSDSEAKDGMDLSLVVVNLETKELQYSGAYNPLYQYRNGELNEIKADKMPISLYVKSDPFSSHKLQLQKGDTIYMFSDGYADQFGGENGRKFKYHKFKEMFKSVYDKPMDEQKKIISETYENWKGDNNQLDDILVIGLRF